jgi:hypothetical protein
MVKVICTDLVRLTFVRHREYQLLSISRCSCRFEEALAGSLFTTSTAMSSAKEAIFVLLVSGISAV